MHMRRRSIHDKTLDGPRWSSLKVLVQPLPVRQRSNGFSWGRKPFLPPFGAFAQARTSFVPARGKFTSSLSSRKPHGGERALRKNQGSGAVGVRMCAMQRVRSKYDAKNGFW